MKEKSKGFTLIEVLAAVTILGIISVVAAISVNKVIQNAKKQHYVTAEDQLKMSGQSYVQQNRSALPKAVGQKTKIPLSVLVEKNYIKQIKDYSDNNCDIEKSYVQVFKYSQSDYSYVPYLDCPAYTSKETIEKGSPSITIQVSDSNKQKVAKADVTITDSEKLLSWSYIVYKEGEEVKNSGSTQLPNYDKSVSRTIDLAKYTPGKIKVVVTATNIYGLSTTETSSVVDFKDTQSPKCIIKEEDLPKNPKPWTTKNVTVTVGCEDGDGSGCKRENFTKTFKTTTDVGGIIIEDEAGNKTTCNVSVNVDITPPSVPSVGLYKWSNNSTAPSSESGLSKYSASSWSPNNIFTKASGSKDQHSGFDKYQYTITGKEPNKTNTDGQTVSITTNGTSKIKYRACDKLGNCSGYSTEYTIKVDKIAPNCSSSGGNSTWTNGNRTLTGTCSDGSGDVSGCSKSSITKLYDYTFESYSETPGVVSDVAGNKTTCPANQTIKIDKIPPTPPTSGSIGGVSGSNKSASIQNAASGSTDKGGSGLSHYLYYVKSSSGTPANTSSGFTTSRGYTRACGQTNYAFAIAVDVAGNRSSVSSLGSSRDAANSYSSWSSCSAKCNGGTQTRTNSCDLVTSGLSQSCNTQGCCDSVYVEWGSWGSCDADCGEGRKHRYGTKYSYYDGRNCGSASDSKYCDAGSCGPSIPANNCNIRGDTKINTGFSWNCTCGRSHTQAYIHYCSDSNGNLVTKSQNPGLVRFAYVCPISPYGPAQGWTVVSD